MKHTTLKERQHMKWNVCGLLAGLATYILAVGTVWFVVTVIAWAIDFFL